MSFLAERALFEHELDAWYAGYPSDVSAIERRLRTVSAQHPEWSSYRRKALVYEAIAADCRVKVFRHFPFYFELDTGKSRADLGAGGVGAWLKGQEFGRGLEAEGQAWWRPCHESGLSLGWPVLDDNHHSIGQDIVFRWGLNGLLARAETRLADARRDEERAFLQGMIVGLRSFVTIAPRFAEEAERMLADETDPAGRERLSRIARTAARVPAEPPATFYEALNTILFIREITQSLEGNGISVLAHVDRILAPYYEGDLAAGRLTRDEAADLLRFFLAFSDVRFGMRGARGHVGTNTTVVIGGCDAQGTPVFNDITRMVIEAYQVLRLVDPKLNARLSPHHPAEYVDLLAGLTTSGSNSLCIFNDDVIIAANVKMGKAPEDARLYVGGGCQENVLENTEINSRATVYLNLAQVLLMGVFPDKWASFTEREGIRPAPLAPCETFEACYAGCLANLAAVVTAHVDQRNRTERQGTRFNPCPLHSAMIDDCIDKATDMMAGGARYSSGSVSLTGIGTLIDSLFAVRRVVYEERQVSWPQLEAMLADDFDGEEAFRQYLVRRVPKFGQEDAAIREFSAQVFADVARISSGHANSRGGRYEASLFAFRSFTSFGEMTGATPDGRKAGEHLSAGMSPSLQALGPKCGIGQVLHALAPLDLSLYPVVAVLDVKLPAAPAGCSPRVVAPVIQHFIANGGSVLQMNWVNPAVLRDARAHPERHPDLVVRVSGYSAYFDSLSEAVQDEVVARTLVTAGDA